MATPRHWSDRTARARFDELVDACLADGPQVALAGSGSSLPYACSKAALNALTLSMARTLAPQVRVNAVCPVLVEQGFVERLAPESFADRAAHQKRVSPVQRLGHPDEVAEAIHWLATSASMMTGSIVELDFGMHLNAV
jgi:NAD(P)-dependent dehydrogenase (short-subunit alcohol dehydrogenase family)